MSKQENHFPASTTSIQPPKTHHRRLYAILAGVLVIIIAVSAVLITQGNPANQTINDPPNSSAYIDDQTDYGSTLPLRLNYAVDEQMTYETTTIIANPLITDEQNLNMTKTMRIISENNDEYKVETKVTFTPNSFDPPVVTTNLHKTSFARNFIPDMSTIFLKENVNPTITAYLTQESVNVGDIWVIPVSTGNSSLGLTGEVTLKFASIENITVPAGTCQTMKIEITSNTLNYHADGTSGFVSLDGQTLQINGATYVEQATCRLVKADLTQVITTSQSTEGSPTTQYSETVLVNHARP